MTRKDDMLPVIVYISQIHRTCSIYMLHLTRSRSLLVLEVESRMILRSSPHSCRPFNLSWSSSSFVTHVCQMIRSSQILVPFSICKLYQSYCPYKLQFPSAIHTQAAALEEECADGSTKTYDKSSMIEETYWMASQIGLHPKPRDFRWTDCWTG